MLGVSGSQDWVWALTILDKKGTWGKWDMCLCFACGSVCGIGGEWVGGLAQGLGRWGGVMFRFSELMAGPGICILCLADSCAS